MTSLETVHERAITQKSCHALSQWNTGSKQTDKQKGQIHKAPKNILNKKYH